MKSLFSVYGYGLGHATRCNAVIKALKGETRVVASDNAYDYFKARGFKPYQINSFKIGSITKSFSWVNTLFENVDFPFTMIADYNIIKQLVREFKPDVIISDTEPVSILLADSARITNCFLSNLVQIPYEYKQLPNSLKNNKLSGQEGVIKMFLSQVLKKSNLLLSPTINSYQAGSKVKFTDLIVRQKPSDLASVKEIRKKHQLPEDFILVSFGGATISREYYQTIIPLLKDFKNQSFVVSTNNAVRRKIKDNNLELHPFINDYLSMLKACKAVICLAGHSTISEALVYNKPCLVIPIQDHVEQLINASLVKKKGFGMAYLSSSELKEGRIKSMIKEFLNRIDEFKQVIKQAGFKGKGDTECAELIQKLK